MSHITYRTALGDPTMLAGLMLAAIAGLLMFALGRSVGDVIVACVAVGTLPVVVRALTGR